ncbi:DUF5667 domain-containing protein [Streptomyces sulphureus]|uniref:DUF5667 domain-containing protein n=1 Tax=Streptomyces sulphureus TaxID=47758 RepID=UPI0003774FB9|nr:DUF5667 domain-containing protein [Streptomyces sulphureus]
MIGSTSTGRRALAFADALERELTEGTAVGEAGPGTDGPAAQQSTAESLSPGPDGGVPLAVAARLASVPRPELAEDVKETQRAGLVAAMERAYAEAPEPSLPAQRDARPEPGGGPLHRLRPKSRWGKGIAVGGLGLTVAAGTLGGVAAASTGALPGDSLYGVKRGMEDLRLDLARDDAARGALLLDHASTRLHEAQRLLERDRSGPLDDSSVTEIRSALSGMHEEAKEGHHLLSSAYRRDGDIARIRSLSAFAGQHRSGWARVEERLPQQLSDVSREVNSVFDAMDDEVRPLRSLLPREDDHAPPEHRRGTGDRTGEEAPSPPPTPRSSDDAGGRTGDHGEAEEPSPTDGSGHEEGLLGGPGVLVPDRDEDDESPSQQEPRPEGPSGPAPELTVPPILPDVLPGLGLGDKE